MELGAACSFLLGEPPHPEQMPAGEAERLLRSAEPRLRRSAEEAEEADTDVGITRVWSVHNALHWSQPEYALLSDIEPLHVLHKRAQGFGRHRRGHPLHPLEVLLSLCRAALHGITKVLALALADVLPLLSHRRVDIGVRAAKGARGAPRRVRSS